MPTSYTSLLGFALPATGELSGTWGDVVNNSITQLVEDSVAGTATQSVAGGNWTLTTTGSGAANQARAAILIPTGSPGVSRNIVAPSSSKAYIVINQSDAAVVLKGAATTGVTIAAGVTSLVAWNGSDFVEIGQAGDVDGPSSATDNAVARFDGTTGRLIQNSVVTIADTTGDIAGAGSITSTSASGILTRAAATQDGVIMAGRAGGTSSYAVTFTPTTLSASRTLTLPDASGTVLQSGTAVTVAQGGTGLTSGTSGGIPYFSSTSAMTSSGVLAANALVVGGGAGVTPSTVTTGANVLTALGVAVGSSGAFTTNNAVNTFTAAQTFRAANAVRSEAASTQDAVVLAGRAGGTSSYAVTFTPTTLTASRTLTLPDASGTILQSGTAVTVAQGGTGATTLTANNVILGNGTSAVNFVAPGTSGNVLTSDGTTWASTAPAGGGGFSNITVFTSSTTWTVPSGVTKCKVTVVGAGGSGGSSDNQDYYAAGGGGGGGTAIKILSLSGSSATITVGTGGSSVSNARASGNAGGTSSFVYGVTTISATGGAGGTASDAANTIQGGVGGIGSSGDLNIGGQGGGTSTWATGVNGLRAGGGAGGSSVYGGGGFGLTNSSANTSPGAGRAYGGGGAGGNSQVASGAGADGVVFVEY